jgi:hypothetical protein
MTTQEMMKTQHKPGYWFENVAPLGDPPNWREKVAPHTPRDDLIFGYTVPDLLAKQYR